ncbi:MAG: iron ABC transporter permease [Clostridia bacterium]|nr:iron ABC transporter permease [Clostridia bacterium]
MMGDQTWIFDFKWIIILAIIDFLLLFQLMPLIYMVIKAFFPDSTFSLETFRRLYTYSLNLDALRNTLIASFATMILGTLLAFPLAWLVGRTNLFGKKFFRALFVLTYMVPPYVGAMAWLRLLNPNVGTINRWLRILFHLSNEPGPLNVYSLPGMIWVLTSFYYPYAFITISRAMEKMDPSLEEASRISGSSPLKTVFTITLPMMMPSLISGALLVFVSAASCYGIPSIIGSPGRVHTVTTRIVEYVALGQQGLNDATGLAVFLMVLAVVILFISDVVLAKRQYITVSGKSVRPAIVDLGRWRIPLTAVVCIFAGIVIFIPFATIFATSFKIDVGKSMFRADNFTLTNWQTVFGRVETMNCFKNSLMYASVAATIGIVIACTMSYLLQRTRIRGRKIPDFLITLGSGTPSVVIALGLIMTMKGNFGINIYNTAYIMIIAYMIKYLMMGMRTVVSAMSQVHVSLEECSQVSGATWMKTMFKITGPLIFPSIAAGWFLIFIPSFYELSMTTLLYSSTTKTIGFQLYEYWTFTSQPMSCAMAFGILLIVVLLNFVLNRLTKGEFSI